jgi:superfamily I DNA/RNA helicase
VFAAQDSGVIPHLEGGTDELKKLIGGVFDLREKGFSSVPEFFGFKTWEEVVEYSETDYGQELATFVRLVETYGAGPLWHLLKRVADDPSQASVTISTTHKAKGREWSSVRLEDDFVQAETDEEGKPLDPRAGEMRILYVALTRAKAWLQIGEQTARFLGL